MNKPMKYLGLNGTLQKSVDGLDLGRDGIGLTVIDAGRSGPISPNQIVIGEALENRDLMNLVADKGARTIVQLPNPDFARLITFCAHVLQHPEEFFSSPETHLTGLGPRSMIDGNVRVHRYPVAPGKEAKAYGPR